MENIKDENKQILVFGATGNIGGAAARELLARGWAVRAVTRNPQSEKAQVLAVFRAPKLLMNEFLTVWAGQPRLPNSPKVF